MIDRIIRAENSSLRPVCEGRKARHPELGPNVVFEVKYNYPSNAEAVLLVLDEKSMRDWAKAFRHAESSAEPSQPLPAEELKGAAKLFVMAAIEQVEDHPLTAKHSLKKKEARGEHGVYAVYESFWPDIWIVQYWPHDFDGSHEGVGVWITKTFEDACTAIESLESDE